MLACCEPQRRKTMPKRNTAIQRKSYCISSLLPYKATLGTTKQNNELDWKKSLFKVTSAKTVAHTKCAFVNVHESDAMSQSSRVLFVHSNIDLTYIKFVCVS